jgi:glyoxylase-like metal-dependent hydrolase (beta-lactamase superfamily II)
MILKQYEVGRFSVFSYLIGDENAKEALVIDPADDADLLLSEAEALGVRITYVVNTHCHVDHIMGNQEMVRRTRAKIVIHEEDAEGLTRTPSALLDMFGAVPSPPADTLVKQGDVIRVGEIGLQVLHTPGHSPGGISVYVDGAVFTGDTLFVGSVGRTDFPGSSFAQLETSLRDRLYVLPGKTVIFPGHNYGPTPTSTILFERRNNPFVRG